MMVVIQLREYNSGPTGDPGKHLPESPESTPGGPISLDFKRGKSIQTYPGGAGPPGGPPGVITTSSNIFLCGVAHLIPSPVEVRRTAVRTARAGAIARWVWNGGTSPGPDGDGEDGFLANPIASTSKAAALSRI